MLRPSSACQSCLVASRQRFLIKIFNLSLQRQAQANRQHLQQRRHFHPSTVLLRAPRVAGARSIKSLYTDTVPPNETQLLASQAFFKTHLPHKSWTATEWRKHSPSSPSNPVLTPEIVFLGRSNSGKSSLLNALLSSPDLCRVGPKPGKTITMHAWALATMHPTTRGALKGRKTMDSKVTVLDMPGYGHGSRREWGEEIVKYLERRRQIRRAFVLINAKHGLKDSDMQMLDVLQKQGVSHQIIACKCDTMHSGKLKETLEEIRQRIQSVSTKGSTTPAIMTLSDVLAVGYLGDGRGNSKMNQSVMQGVQDVRWAVLRAAGLEEYAMKLLLEDGSRPPTNVQTTITPQLQQPKEAIIEDTIPDNDPTQTIYEPAFEHSQSSPPTITPEFTTSAPPSPSPSLTSREKPPSPSRPHIYTPSPPSNPPRTRTSSSDSKIGIGIDELLEMTGLNAMKSAAAAANPKPQRRIVSRRELLRRKRNSV